MWNVLILHSQTGRCQRLYLVSSRERLWRQRKNASFVCQSSGIFLNVWENTKVTCAIRSVLFCTTRWRHGRSRGETNYSSIRMSKIVMSTGIDLRIKICIAMVCLNSYTSRNVCASRLFKDGSIAILYKSNWMLVLSSMQEYSCSFKWDTILTCGLHVI